MNRMFGDFSRDISQILIQKDDTAVYIRNESKKVWFKYRFDLTDEQIFKRLHRIIKRKKNLFLYMVFYKLKERTKTIDENHRYYKNIEAMRKEIQNIYDELIQEHEFDIKKIDDYEAEVPNVKVSFGDVDFCISSEMFSGQFFVWNMPGPANQTPIPPPVEIIQQVKQGILSNFQTFSNVVYGKIDNKIRCRLIKMDKTRLKDPLLLEYKNMLNERITKPISELKEWVKNNKNIPGMDKVVGWDLMHDGKFIQIRYTKLLKDDGVFDILGVENKPNSYGKNPTTNKPYDVDIELGYEKSRIPVQVYVREGDLSRQIRNSTSLVGENPKGVPGVIDQYGATNDNYGKVEDYCQIVGKLAKTPPNGILLIISNTLPNNPGIIPLKEWWCNGILDDKCIIIKRGDRITIYSNPGFDTKNAKKLAQSLGDARPESETRSNFTLCGDFLTEAFSESQAGTS